jgi:hypothetical protein
MARKDSPQKEKIKSYRYREYLLRTKSMGILSKRFNQEETYTIRPLFDGSRTEETWSQFHN